MKSALFATKPLESGCRMSFRGVDWKQFLACVALSGLLSCASSMAQGNILSNANLDQTSVSSQNRATPTGWVVDASKTLTGEFFDGASSETFCNVADEGGFGLFFKPFQGSDSGDYITVHFYQDNPTTAAPSSRSPATRLPRPTTRDSFPEVPRKPCLWFSSWTVPEACWRATCLT
jgi:hypothetical protein